MAVNNTQNNYAKMEFPLTIKRPGCVQHRPHRDLALS